MGPGVRGATYREEIQRQRKYLQALYRAYAPIYDRCLGRLFRDGHTKGIGRLAEGAPLRVLDVGVGTGLSLRHYGPQHRVTGIDVSPAMLAIAGRKRAESAAAEVCLMNMDASDLRFADAHFDAVVMFYALSVVATPAAVLAEALRVLRPGGDLIVVNHSASSNLVVRALERALSPLAKVMGFRSDLRVEDCLSANPAIRPIHVESANVLGYWSVFHCKKRERA